MEREIRRLLVGNGERGLWRRRHALSITDMPRLPYGDHDLLMKFQVTSISPVSSEANCLNRAGDMSRVMVEGWAAKPSNCKMEWEHTDVIRPTRLTAIHSLTICRISIAGVDNVHPLYKKRSTRIAVRRIKVYLITIGAIIVVVSSYTDCEYHVVVVVRITAVAQS